MLRNAPPAAEGRDSWHPEIEAAESCVCLGRRNWSRVGLARFLAQAAACLRVSALAGAERALGSVAGALLAAARRAGGGRSFMVRMTAWEGDARAAAGAPRPRPKQRRAATLTLVKSHTCCYWRAQSLCRGAAAHHTEHAAAAGLAPGTATGSWLGVTDVQLHDPLIFASRPASLGLGSSVRRWLAGLPG